jgi:hypothetical protein
MRPITGAVGHPITRATSGHATQRNRTGFSAEVSPPQRPFLRPQQERPVAARQRRPLGPPALSATAHRGVEGRAMSS